MEFGQLQIEFDDRVLRPRTWTSAQSYWAAEIARSVPAGTVLELCSGAGQIGLLAVLQTSRRLVCVDAEPAAVELTLRNLAAAGLTGRVETRLGRMRDSVVDGEQFPLIVADPPWVPRGRVSEFPEDPLLAIDGGPNGMDVALECLEVIAGHLLAGGAAVLQLGTLEQAEALQGALDEAGLVLTETREYDGRGVLVRIDRPA